MTNEVDYIIRKIFNGHTMKNMSLITHVFNPSELLDMTSVGSRSMPVDDYPLFTQEEPKEVLKYYNVSSLTKGFPKDVLNYDELPETFVDVYSLKRKMKLKYSDEEPSGSARTPTKVARTSGLNIMSYTMRPIAESVRSETDRSSKMTPSRNHGKSPMIETPFYTASYIVITSSIPPQTSSPPYIPFGAITTLLLNSLVLLKQPPHPFHPFLSPFPYLT